MLKPEIIRACLALAFLFAQWTAGVHAAEGEHDHAEHDCEICLSAAALVGEAPGVAIVEAPCFVVGVSRIACLLDGPSSAAFSGAYRTRAPPRG